MRDFVLTIEMLIDKLILYLPSELFVEAPFITALLDDPNGRYVLSGVVVVTGLLALWILLSISQLMFVNVLRKHKPDTLQSHSKSAGQKIELASEGFHFFKRKTTIVSMSDSDRALRLVEQEMLAIRQNFFDGHVLKDVYVTETRRLYVKANKLKA